MTTTLTGPIAPLISPVQNPTLNGTSLFNATASSTTTPTLGWNPPTGLTPSGYAVFVIRIGSTNVTSLFTTGTSLTIPPGFLSEGSIYYFIIQAVANGRTDFTTSPNRSLFPYAFSQVTSQLITIGNSATQSSVSLQAARPKRQSSQQQFGLANPGGPAHLAIQ